MALCELRRGVWIGGVAGAYRLGIPRTGGRRVFAQQIAAQGALPTAQNDERSFLEALFGLNYGANSASHSPSV